MMEQTTQNSDLLIGTIGRIENLIRSDDHSEVCKRVDEASFYLSVFCFTEIKTAKFAFFRYG